MLGKKAAAVLDGNPDPTCQPSPHYGARFLPSATTEPSRTELPGREDGTQSTCHRSMSTLRHMALQSLLTARHNKPAWTHSGAYVPEIS